jgi:hypothetical protein
MRSSSLSWASPRRPSFYDPFKTPWAVWHRRETPLVPYSFVATFLVLLAIFEGGWLLVNALPSGPERMLP